jgi:SAM-dependent methyltransferase
MIHRTDSMNTNQHIKNYWNNENLWSIYGLESYYADRSSFIKGMLPNDIDKILDVGSGKGEIVNDIYQLYSNVTALDIAIEALNHLNCKLKVNGSIEALPFESNSYDLIICLEVLEHLKDSSFETGIFELQRVADKYLLIGVPYNENIDSRKTRCPSCRSIFNADTHLRSFDSLSSLCLWFPQFELVNDVLIGPLSRKPTSLGMWIQHVVADAYLPWEPYFACFNCGFTETYPAQQMRLLKHRVGMKINRLLSLTNRKMPCWLIVLLQKKR